MFPIVDFGEGNKWLSIAEEAYLTEEKYTLIVPILTKLAEVKLRATGQKLFRTEYVDLKRKLVPHANLCKEAGMGKLPMQW